MKQKKAKSHNINEFVFCTLVQTMKHHMENLFLKGTTGGQESKKSSTEELSVSVDFFTTEKHGPGSSLLGHISDVEVQQYLGACHSL